MGGVFEQFTDGARRVVALAAEEARMLWHRYIGTEHILLGLIREGEGIGAKSLESLGISLEATRAQIEEIAGQGMEAPSWRPNDPPYTPRAKKVLEYSSREAMQRDHEYTGTEHVLLGLIREGEGVGPQVLVKLGVGLSRLRQQVIELLPEADDETERRDTGQAGDEAHPSPRDDAALTSRLDDVQATLAEISQRLTTIERRLDIE